MEEPPTARFSSITFLAGFGFGAFAGVALALVAVLITNPGTDTVIVTPLVVAETPSVTGTPVTPQSQPRAKVALDVLLGPGSGYAVIGLLARGESIEPVGRDD